MDLCPCPRLFLASSPQACQACLCDSCYLYSRKSPLPPSLGDLPGNSLYGDIHFSVSKLKQLENLCIQPHEVAIHENSNSANCTTCVCLNASSKTACLNAQIAPLNNAPIFRKH